jgi:quinol monooxygenase YgiN
MRNAPVTEAISIIEVHTRHLAASSCASQLSSLATLMLDTPGCITYQALHNPGRSGLWIITGLWESTQAMERHFHHPALGELINLLGAESVSKVTASSFPSSATARSCDHGHLDT